MMEVRSAVKGSTGSAFSIDSIMSRRDRDRDRDSREAVSVVAGTSRDPDQRGGLPSVCTVTVPPVPPARSLHGSPLPSAATASVTTSCACPVSPLESLSSTGSISHPHPHHPSSPHSPTNSPLSDSLHHPGLTAAAVAARNSNGLHQSHLSLSVSAAKAEAALLHNRAIAAAAAVQSAHTLHAQQQQQTAAMAAGLSALDPHGGTAALTAGGVGTIPTLPSFSTLTHHPADRGLAALQALSHKIPGLPPSLGVSGLPGGGAGGPLTPHHHGLGNGLAGLGPKHVLPFYSWFSRPGGYWTHRLPGKIYF